MEFVSYREAIEALSDLGVEEMREGDERLYLHLPDSEQNVHLHLACMESAATPRDGAIIHSIDKSRLPQLIEHLMHKLHLQEVLLVPVGRWRKVFDAVAFALAANEDWQEVDAMATVELNTRDPLLCGPGDFHTIAALIDALLLSAETSDQGLMVTTTVRPLMVEIVPDGCARITVGDPVLADQIVDRVARGENVR